MSASNMRPPFARERPARADDLSSRPAPLAFPGRVRFRAISWPLVTGALIVFVLSYLVIASPRLARGRLDRPTAALVGAVAMVVIGGLDHRAALASVKLDVVTLLLGVMLIAAYLAEARFFRWTAWLVLTRTRSARGLLWSLTFVAGALSALLVNDTVCLVLTPLVVAVTIEAGLPALPYLLTLASASNLGGVVSFSGNPQNMIIGQAAQGAPGFAEYLLLTLPVGVACLVANAAVLTWAFRDELPRGDLPPHTPEAPAFDPVLAGKGLAALALFAALALAEVDLAGAAIAAAAVLVIAAGTPPRRVLETIDWSILLFFAGLFVIVEGLRATGVLAEAFAAMAPLVARGDAAGDAAFVALTVVGSNLVSNVPLVMIAVDWVPRMPEPAWGWVMLAVASTLAGNLTLMGSVANIIVMETAGARGEIGFLRFFRFGLVMTAVSLVVAFAVLWLERQLGVMALLGV
jgi:Na+/H+ antiporter NhaD/arsenite permease-like protein